MFAQGDVHGRAAIVHRQIFVRYGTGEEKALVQQLIVAHQGANGRVVARHRVVLADEDEPVVGVEVSFVVLRQLDVVFDLLVGRDAADEEEVHEVVVEGPFERGPRGGGRDAGQVDRQWQHTRRVEPDVLELAAIELGNAKREVGPADQRRQFLARAARRA